MQQTAIRVLLVDDDEADARLAQNELAQAAATLFDVTHVKCVDAALERLVAQAFDVVLLDLSLPDSDGLDTFVRLRIAAPAVAVVVLSRRADERRALQAVQAGAHDYLVKGQQVEGLLVRAIRHAVERAQSENAMRQVKVRLQRIIDGTDDGLWDWLDVREETIWWSPSYYAQLGYTSNEMAPTLGNFRSLLHPDDQQPGIQVVADALAGRGDIDWEYQLKNKGGEYRWFKARGKVYRDGARISMAGSTTDITQHKRMTDELERHRHHLEDMVALRMTELQEARQQADAANAAKSVFLANMSHEIRTPMHAILGFAHLLRRDTALPQQVERLDKIKSAGQHLLAVINDILDISKIEAEALELENIDFNLASVFDNVNAMVGQSAYDKDLRLTFDRASVTMGLKGDPMRLGQALLNYASNAVKFTEKGGVALRVRLLEDDGVSVLLRFEVEDTGPGIAPDKLERLFRTFGQADASTTRNHGGTGLGLVITRRLAQLMGGDAGAESNWGQGTLFWFTARLQHGATCADGSGAAAHIDPQAELLGHHAGTRILVADDDPFNREIALEMFDGMGLIVDAVSNGQEALAAVQAQAYDLVLMDVQMPVMDGLAATRAIRALPGWAHAPIVAMTANVFAEDRRACLDAGMSDIVPKPIDPNDLYFSLLKWLPASHTQ